MSQNPIWIVGSTRSGKTTRLVSQFCQWIEEGLLHSSQASRPVSRMTRRDRQRTPPILIFAANDENRRDLTERLITAIQGRHPVRAKTPLGFFQDEVMLFWPLLIRRLNLKAQFPLRLRPETEQELALGLWGRESEKWSLLLPEANEPVKVRRILDLLQLAAVSGTPIEDIPSFLEQGILPEEGTPEHWEDVGQLLLEWRHWCLERGFLTYGIICDLYWSQLLPDPTYQQHLRQRYRAVLADDTDDYPAIARDLFECLLDQEAVGAFTYNPDGKVRLGLNADPDYLEGLAGRCQMETLTPLPIGSMSAVLGDTAVELVNDPLFLTGLPESVQSLQTTSRAALLRQTAELISDAVQSGRVAPGEIAIIAPGLDAIARYVITDILIKQGILVEPLNEQRPLISSPMIRALLTLLALVYPGLGRLVDRDAIAEMLVVLSQKQGNWEIGEQAGQAGQGDKGESSQFPIPHIDPVRAGLLADHCYTPDLENPRLLPIESFQRWDRLGNRATAAYTEIVQWLEEQRSQQQQRLIPSVVAVLDRAIQKFLWNGSNLPYDQLAALRELMETAQHYWEVDGRLRQELKVGRLKVESSDPSSNFQPSTQTNLQPSNFQPSTQTNLQPSNLQPSNLPTFQPSNLQPATQPPTHTTIAKFIQLLRLGTVTANPYPVRRLAPNANNAVTLATIFQYRANRRSHRWHFWLDAGSPLWLSGGAATLFGAHLFLKDWSGRPWMEEDKIAADNDRLQRILRDLLGRVSDRVYLCHSDLAVNGTEQNGPLLTLVHAAVPLTADSQTEQEADATLSF